MRITKLSYENFRNLEDDNIYPDEEINIIYGDNAQGKTNLLEAIWLFTGGHSFRGNKDRELPKIINYKNSKLAKLHAEFFSEQRDQWAVLNFNSGKKNSVINGVEKKTGSALVGKICAVVFSPEHLLLIKEGPALRRSFIDGAICQIKPGYTKILSKYNRVLMQRNALLRQMQSNSDLKDMLEVWDSRLISFGTEIINKRINYVKALNERAREIYFGISENKEEFSISYLPLGNKDDDFLEKSEEIFRKALKKSLKNDIKLGITSVGPHRDDCEIVINNLVTRTYGSQGQQRSAVIAMKLAEASVLEKNIGETPIILLDDVMSELDNKRQNYILNKLTGRQIFISCCNPNTVNLMQRGKMFYVKEGKIT